MGKGERKEERARRWMDGWRGRHVVMLPVCTVLYETHQRRKT